MFVLFGSRVFEDCRGCARLPDETTPKWRGCHTAYRICQALQSAPHSTVLRDVYRFVSPRFSVFPIISIICLVLLSVLLSYQVLGRGVQLRERQKSQCCCSNGSQWKLFITGRSDEKPMIWRDVFHNRYSEKYEGATSTWKLRICYPILELQAYSSKRVGKPRAPP